MFSAVCARSARPSNTTYALDRIHLPFQKETPRFLILGVHIWRYSRRMNKGRGNSWGEGAGYHPELPKLIVKAPAKKITMPDEMGAPAGLGLLPGHGQITRRKSAGI